MRNLLIVAIGLIVIPYFLPIPNPGNHGAYNTITHTIWCNERSACIHEIGHKVDQESGFISQTAEFSTALSDYVFETQNNPTFLSRFIVVFPQVAMQREYSMNDQAELYATILSLSSGKSENMPEIFRKFYNWPRIDQLMVDY